MKKVLVEIYYSGNNFSAHAPDLPGCVSTGTTLSEVKSNISEAIAFHVESSLENKDNLPDTFMGQYELDFKITVEALLNAYSDVFTKAALSRITGINQRQLWHYASGLRKPRPMQRKRIEQGLHRLGKELLDIDI